MAARRNGFNPNQRRDGDGMWTRSGGGGSAGDVEAAHADLVQGKAVTVDPDHVDALMRQSAGGPIYNLTRVQVTGTDNRNIFRRHARDIPRSEMPQLSRRDGSLDAFNRTLAERGVSVRQESVDPRTLTATQNQLEGVKVSKLYETLKAEGWPERSAMFVSREGAVLDGHHRWAAAAALAVAGPMNVNVLRVDTDIDSLLDIAHTVSAPRKGLGDVAVAAAQPATEIVTDTDDGVPEELFGEQPAGGVKATRDGFDPHQPRDGDGKWSETPGGDGDSLAGLLDRDNPTTRATLTSRLAAGDGTPTQRKQWADAVADFDRLANEGEQAGGGKGFDRFRAQLDIAEDPTAVLDQRWPAFKTDAVRAAALRALWQEQESRASKGRRPAAPSREDVDRGQRKSAQLAQTLTVDRLRLKPVTTTDDVRTLDDTGADNPPDFRFITDPEQRATYLWQKRYDTQQAVRAGVLNLAAGKDPGDGVELPASMRQFVGDGYTEQDVRDALDDAARRMFNRFAESKGASGSLHRGMYVEATPEQVRQMFAVDGLLGLPVASFTRREREAARYAVPADTPTAPRPTGDGVAVMVTVPSGAPLAVDLADSGVLAGSEEVLLMGHLRVTYAAYDDKANTLYINAEPVLMAMQQPQQLYSSAGTAVDDWGDSDEPDVAARRRRGFDPNQKRDEDGKWTRTGGGGGSTGGGSTGGGSTGGGKPAGGGRTGGEYGPMTDAEFEARQKMVADTIGKARKTHSTDITHTTADGAWKPERDKLHREIAAELYAKADKVPTDGKAVIAGGLGGAGKSTVLRDHAGIDQSQYLTLNPDDVKELMAERGLIPDVPDHPDLSPMERAALVHEESSRITKLLADMAYRDRRNVIWDITMSSEDGVVSRLAALDGNGYTTRGVFVDIPVEVSVERALTRYRRGADQYRAGKGQGGRFVPPSIIRAQRTSSGATINREVFDRLADRFNGWSVYDNSVTGRAPQLIADNSGGGASAT